MTGPITPIYGWPFQALTDPPDGAALGEDLALAIEATLASLATEVAGLTAQVNGSEDRLSQGVIGSGYAATVGTVATSAGVETAVPTASWTVEPTAVFPPGRVSRVDVQLGAFPSAATASITRVRIRKGQATIVGTLLWTWWLELGTAAATTAPSFNLFGYIKNTTAAEVTTELSITNTRHSGAANTSLFMNASTPLPGLVTVTDMGRVVDLPNIAALAASV